MKVARRDDQNGSRRVSRVDLLGYIGNLRTGDEYKLPDASWRPYCYLLRDYLLISNMYDVSNKVPCVEYRSLATLAHYMSNPSGLRKIFTQFGVG